MLKAAGCQGDPSTAQTPVLTSTVATKGAQPPRMLGLVPKAARPANAALTGAATRAVGTRVRSTHAAEAFALTKPCDFANGRSAIVTPSCAEPNAPSGLTESTGGRAISRLIFQRRSLLLLRRRERLRADTRYAEIPHLFESNGTDPPPPARLTAGRPPPAACRSSRSRRASPVGPPACDWEGQIDWRLWRPSTRFCST